MTAVASTSIWGRLTEPVLVDPKHALQAVESQLRSFLRSEIEDAQPDLLVLHERKGTAIARAMIESEADGLSWKWKHTVSSVAIDQLPDEQIVGKSILVFDDMMRTGANVRRVVDRLLARGATRAGGSIRVAVFAIHEEAEASEHWRGDKVSCSWFYRHLSTPAFQQIRQQLVSLLQDAGSLMLDTEHLEVRLTLRGTFSQLLSAVQRRASAVAFHSYGQRTNVTVYYDHDEAHSLPTDRFPKGIGFGNIVKKCRLIQRAGDEFAIIPICLPTVPHEWHGWRPCPEDAAMLGDGFDCDPMSRFYAMALLGSLYPLEWILRDLYAFGSDLFTLSLPRASLDIGSGYSLDHLLAMYPRLHLDLLTKTIMTVQDRAEKWGRELHRRKTETPPLHNWSDRQLHRDALVLLQLIADKLQTEGTEEGAEGLRLKDIFNIGYERKWQAPHISALFDILIDNAQLVTRVSPCKDDQGERAWIRTFKPDGEVVSDLVRRYSRQWGLPRGS